MIKLRKIKCDVVVVGAVRWLDVREDIVARLRVGYGIGGEVYMMRE